MFVISETMFELNLLCCISVSFYFILLKGYLRYKTIFCHKVALDAQLMNFFV